jgi:hypothetical protein
MIVKVGSRWSGNEGKQFLVLAEVYLDDGVWIHYREITDHESPREYSCYRDSFLSRFSICP